MCCICVEVVSLTVYQKVISSVSEFSTGSVAFIFSLKITKTTKLQLFNFQKVKRNAHTSSSSDVSSPIEAPWVRAIKLRTMTAALALKEININYAL